MKKTVVRIAIFLLAIAMAFSLSGCKDDPPPEPPPPAPASQTPSPAPSQSPAPSPAPAPVLEQDDYYSDYGLLETAERYYLYGDEGSAYCIFFSDDTVQDEFGDEGEFDVFGDLIFIYFNGEHVATLEIMDFYTLEDVESGVKWIREGGFGYNPEEPVPAYVSAGLPPIIFGKYYYLEGDSDDVSLYFWEDGDVDIEGGNENIYGEYIYTGDAIVITREGRTVLILSIDNPAELSDVNSWDSYYFEGAHTYELETAERYFLNGDTDGLNLWFWSDGTLDIETPAGDTISTDYYTIGYTVYASVGGDDITMEIVNSYVLMDEFNGDMFIRMP